MRMKSKKHFRLALILQIVVTVTAFSTNFASAKQGLQKLALESTPVLIDVQRLIQRIQLSGSSEPFGVAVSTTSSAAFKTLESDRRLLERENERFSENDRAAAVLGYFEGIRLLRTLGELAGYARVGRSESELAQMSLTLSIRMGSLLQKMDESHSEQPDFQFHPINDRLVRVQANPTTSLTVSLQNLLINPTPDNYDSYVKLDMFKLALMERATIELALKNTPFEKNEARLPVADAPPQAGVLRSWSQQLVWEKEVRTKLTSKVFEEMGKVITLHVDSIAPEFQQAIAQMILTGKINRWYGIEPTKKFFTEAGVFKAARKISLYYQLSLGLAADESRQEMIREKWIGLNNKIENKRDERTKVLAAAIKHYPGLWTNMSHETLKGFLAHTAATVEAQFAAALFIGDLHPALSQCKGTRKPTHCPTDNEKAAITREFQELFLSHFQQSKFKNEIVQPVLKTLPKAAKLIPVTARFDTAQELFNNVKILNAQRKITQQLNTNKLVSVNQLPTEINWIFAMAAAAGNHAVPDWYLLLIDPSARKSGSQNLLQIPSLLLDSYRPFRAGAIDRQTQGILKAEIKSREKFDQAFYNAGFKTRWMILAAKSPTYEIRSLAFSVLALYTQIEEIGKLSSNAMSDLYGRLEDISEYLFGLDEDLHESTTGELIQAMENDFIQTENFVKGKLNWVSIFATASQSNLNRATDVMRGELSKADCLIRYHTLIEHEIYSNHPILKYRFKMPLVENPKNDFAGDWVTVSVEALLSSLPAAIFNLSPASPAWISEWVGSQGQMQFPFTPQQIGLAIARTQKSPPSQEAFEGLIRSGQKWYKEVVQDNQEERVNPSIEKITNWGNQWTSSDTAFWTSLSGTYARKLKNDLAMNIEKSREFAVKVTFAQLLQPILNTGLKRNTATLNQISACLKDEKCKDLSLPFSQTVQGLKQKLNSNLGGVIQRFQNQATRNTDVFSRWLSRFEKWNEKYAPFVYLSLLMRTRTTVGLNAFDLAKNSALHEFGFFGVQAVVGLAQLGLISGVAYEYYQSYQATKGWRNTAVFSTVTQTQSAAQELEALAYNKVSTATSEVLMNLPIQIMMVRGAFQFTTMSSDISRFKELQFSSESQFSENYGGRFSKYDLEARQAHDYLTPNNQAYDIDLAYEITGLQKGVKYEDFVHYKDRILARAERKYSGRGKNSEQAVMFEEYRAKLKTAFEIIARNANFK